MSEIEKIVKKLTEIIDTGVNCEDCIFQCESDESCTLCAIKDVMQEKQEREKGCSECEPNCHNCKHDVYDDFCRFYGTHGCDKEHFEPRSNFCQNCGRDLRGKNDGRIKGV